MSTLAWRYCPACGASLGRKEVGGLPRAHCPACGALYFDNSKPCVGALIEREDDHVLLAERNIEPYRGHWDIIGGFLEAGEDPIDGLHREVREETGLEIEPVTLLGAWPDTYGDGGAYTLNLYYRCRIVSGTPEAADDVAALKWFPRSALPPLAFRHMERVRKVWAAAPPLF